MRQFAWGVGVAIAAGGVLAAQQQAPTRPAFRSGVDLVRFDLSVTDDQGRPLADVRPDEVEILENGKPLPIVLFQRVQEPAGFYTEAAIRAVSAEVTSNDATPRGHLYIFVFDQQHITPGNEQKVRDAAASFIRGRVRASDRIAIYGVPGPGPDLAFTSDLRRATAELDKVRGGYETMLNTSVGVLGVDEAYEIAAGDRAIADIVARRLAVDLSSDSGSSLSSSSSATDSRARRARESTTEDYGAQLRGVTENARVVVQQQDGVSRDFLQRLSDLMVQFKRVEGRKTVVLFSEGFHDQNVSRELQDVAAAAAESYSVVYAMDLNRRDVPLSSAAQTATTTGIEAQRRTAPLASLALETDGVFVNDATSRLDTALKQIADQAQDYYLAGFLPSPEALAQRGSYRRVTVRVKRPGARVSARTGYAVPSNAAAPDRRNAIDAALAAPFSQQALKVAYTTYVLRSEATGHPRVVLSLDADLPLRDERHDRADVVFLVRDTRGGRVVASGSDTMPLPDAPTPGEYLGRSTYRVQFDVPSGTYMMRAVVREPGGLLGSADRRLEVRDVAGPSVATSDLVLASANRSLPVRAQVYTQDGLSGMLEIYGRSPEQLGRVRVGVSLGPENGSDARTFDAALDEPESVPGGAVRRARFSLPLSSVAPGAYVARARVQDGKDEVATLTRQLDIVAGTAPAPPSPPPADPRLVAQGALFKRAEGEWLTAPAAPAAHATKGFDLFKRGDFTGAAAELEQAFDTNQKSAATAFVLGWAWQGAGETRKAIGAWRAAAAADPSIVPAHLAIADAYLELSHPELAAQALQAGLAARPDSVELQTKLGQIEKRR
jgi:VWFA-related protein